MLRTLGFILVVPMLVGAVTIAHIQQPESAAMTRAAAGKAVYLPLLRASAAPTSAPSELASAPASMSPAPQPASAPVAMPDLPFDPFATRTGDATTYNYNRIGNCTLDPLPPGTLLAAINQADYHGSAMCGAYLEVIGPRATVQVVVADRCPGCRSGDLDFNLPAFEELIGATTGRIPVRWRIISPPLDGPIAYRFQGSNPYYAKVQVLNHRNPVHSMEARAPDGGWVQLTRKNDNFFVIPNGTIPEPYITLTLRTTDMYGNTITDSRIEIVNDVKIPGVGQFPPAP